VASAPADEEHMCGPPEMMRTFQKELRAHGAARHHIRWEQFGLR
jgi:ferredoxin-NADP reductase